jgi:hypothetical protein
MMSKKYTETRRADGPAGGSVGVLYDLPAQRVRVADAIAKPVYEVSVSEAVDVLNGLPGQYFRRIPRPSSPDSTHIVVPGQPFPRFRLGGF